MTTKILAHLQLIHTLSDHLVNRHSQMTTEEQLAMVKRMEIHLDQAQRQLWLCCYPVGWQPDEEANGAH